MTGDDEAMTAQEKRLKAERLAIQAERAALEAERMALEASQLKAKTTSKKQEAEVKEERAAFFKEEEEKAEEKSASLAGFFLKSDEEKAAEAAAARQEAATAPPPPVEGTAPVESSTDAEKEEEEKEDGPFAKLFAGLGNNTEPPPFAYGSIAEVVQGQEAASVQLTDAQLEVCENSVFDLESFYLQGKPEQTFLGTLFRGNLRTNSSVAYERVSQNAAKIPMLKGVTFLLLKDPIPPGLDSLDSEVEERRPVFLALQDSSTEKYLKQGIGQYFTAIAALFSSIITTLGFALSTYILADGGYILEQLEKGDTGPVDVVAPIAFGILGVFAVHELGHLLAARKNKVDIGIPYFLPSLQLGVFGCFTRLTNFPPNRKALFEFALSGPLIGLLFSLVLYLVGIFLSIDLELPKSVMDNIAAATAAANSGGVGITGTSAADTTAAAIASGAGSGADMGWASSGLSMSELMPVVPSSLIQSSLLLGGIATALLPGLANGNELAVVLHPLAVVGFVGALVNALQLIPIGRLDGGRVCLAVLGQSAAGLVSGLTTFILGLTVLNTDSPILTFFLLVVLFLQRSQELPAKDDLTEVSGAYSAIAFASLALTLTILLPYPVAEVASQVSDGFGF